MKRLRQVARWRLRLPVAAWVAVLAIVGLAVLAACIYVLPKMLVPDRPAGSLKDVTDSAKKLELEDARLKQRNDVRATLLSNLAGAAVVIGLALTWRQVRVSQEGQITERFNKAIDHLGSDNLDLRLGGIYALERIAKNSSVDRDTIGEILTAFVRQRSPWPPSQPGQYREDVLIKQQPKLRRRAADIQAALTVLGRGGFTREGALSLDLAEVDLRHASLVGAHLENANLIGAHLEGATLHSAHLEGANLVRAHLEHTMLQNTHFEGAHLDAAYLTGAQLPGAHLKGATLHGTYLTGVYLGNAADLTGTNLDDAKVGGAFADESTVWPDGFDARSNGIKFLA